MANSSWMGLSNEVYKLAGLKPVDSAATFNDDSLLEKPYMQGKYAIKLAHSHLSTRAVRHFTTRRFQLPVSAGTAIYALDTGINPSAMKYETFFNVTAGGDDPARLGVMTEEEFNTLYPDAGDVPTGAPTHFILLASARTDISPVWKVRIFPTPDASYDLQYKAKLNAYPLTEAADVVLWPVEYEHVLVEWAWSMLERALGEGKEGIIYQLAKEAANDVLLVSGVPDDERKAVKTIKPINNRSSKYPYNYNRVLW